MTTCFRLTKTSQWVPWSLLPLPSQRRTLTRYLGSLTSVPLLNVVLQLAQMQIDNLQTGDGSLPHLEGERPITRSRGSGLPSFRGGRGGRGRGGGVLYPQRLVRLRLFNLLAGAYTTSGFLGAREECYRAYQLCSRTRNGY